MNAHIMNSLSDVIMSPIIDKMIKKTFAEEIRDLYNSLEFMNDNEMTQEAFSLSHIIIESSGVRLQDEYLCIVDNAKLRADFVEEIIADLEDILYHLE